MTGNNAVIKAPWAGPVPGSPAAGRWPREARSTHWHQCHRQQGHHRRRTGFQQSGHDRG
jgi:hypothetical protein